MGCKDCAERRKNLRDAIMHGKMADALDITVEGLRAMIRVDADADHRKASVVTPSLPNLSGKTKAELLEIAAGEDVIVPEGSTNAEIIELIESKRRGLA